MAQAKTTRVRSFTAGQASPPGVRSVLLLDSQVKPVIQSVSLPPREEKID